MACEKYFEVRVRMMNLGVSKSNLCFSKFQSISIYRTEWAKNPHFLGSYSYPSVKGDAIGASAAALAEPILDSDSQPIIQFAGEATNSHHFSTVHGAIESGWFQAQKLIDLYLKRSKL